MTVIPLKFLALLPLVWGVWLAGFITEYPRGGLADAVGTAEVVPAAAVLSGDTIQQWRRDKIKAIWNRVHGSGEPLSEDRLNAFMAGDFTTLGDSSVRPTAFILSGTPELQPSPAGMLLAGKDGQYWPVCSAVLTRPSTVLSAGHCISRLSADMQLKVYLPFEGFRDVARNKIRMPCADGHDICDIDLAIIELAEPFNHVSPATLKTDSRAVPGSPVRTLGFGMTSEILSDNGLMHAGKSYTERCGCKSQGDARDHSLCFTTAYDDGLTIINSYANFAIDSGAPLFEGSLTEFNLLGIARGIEKGCSSQGKVESQYTDLTNLPLGHGMTEAFCSKDCQQSEHHRKSILEQVDLALTRDSSANEYPLRIEAGVKQLLLTLNHEIFGFTPEPGADLTLVLPDELDASCQRYYGVEACSVNNPDPGVYNVRIETVSGRPAYQLAAVAIHQGD